MLKSCDYCRHRKKKCLLPTPLASRCCDCEHLNIPCEFSRRNVSLKRQRTSQLVAARISNSTPTNSRWPTVVLKNGDTQLRVVDTSNVADKIILMGDQSDDGKGIMVVADMYRKTVRPLTPFLPEEMLAGDDVERDIVLRYCIQLASFLSPHDRRDLPAASQVNNDLSTMLGDEEISLASAAGILLLLLRVDIDETIAKRVGTFR